MKLVWSSRFTRSAKRLARRNRGLLDKVDATLRRLEADPYHPSLRTHKLSGDFAECWACSAGQDVRIIFEFVKIKQGEELEIHLLNVGTHDEVY